ncbi:hypothetical protein GCM10007094_22780 [Pseudovibrio japonicus]|uniref:Uncharacterized protein n=1 Tax=Pseudovibrio japonicus TaxID=366534 RepID=A0ABQ3ECA9_9HYPH|nr:hypothetical protein [Pseudovibrio japonicus]GHB33205.1 hypothetical protein GCM10007094_22780 [Pseudovibrio japonicus]
MISSIDYFKRPAINTTTDISYYQSQEEQEDGHSVELQRDLMLLTIASAPSAFALRQTAFALLTESLPLRTTDNEKLVLLRW